MPWDETWFGGSATGRGRGSFDPGAQVVVSFVHAPVVARENLVEPGAGNRGQPIPHVRDRHAGDVSRRRPPGTVVLHEPKRHSIDHVPEVSQRVDARKVGSLLEVADRMDSDG